MGVLLGFSLAFNFVLLFSIFVLAESAKSVIKSELNKCSNKKYSE